MSIDVEGGAATLYVTPGGRSLLIDAGWPSDAPEPGRAASVARIVAAAKAEGLRRIDVLLVSHYHVDHVGGAIDLLRAFPVGRVVDHGPNREAAPTDQPLPAWSPAALYPRYLAAIGPRSRQVMKAGERFVLDGMTVTAVNSDGTARKLAVAGATPPDCAAATDPSRAIGGEENPRSLGVVIGWGKTRILSLADTTWNMEASLVCPRDGIGTVDLMFANNHGSAISNNRVLLAAVAPRAVVVNNGPTKGGEAPTFATAAALGIPVWQLHAAARLADGNAPEARIANLAAGDDGAHPLIIEVGRDASIVIGNARTGGKEEVARR